MVGKSSGARDVPRAHSSRPSVSEAHEREQYRPRWFLEGSPSSGALDRLRKVRVEVHAAAPSDDDYDHEDQVCDKHDREEDPFAGRRHIFVPAEAERRLKDQCADRNTTVSRSAMRAESMIRARTPSITL